MVFISRSRCARCTKSFRKNEGHIVGSGWSFAPKSSRIYCKVCVSDVFGLRVSNSIFAPGERGLFLTRDFQADELIIPYCGKLQKLSELQKRKDEPASPYCVEFGYGYRIDAPDPFEHGLARFINDVHPFSRATDTNTYFAYIDLEDREGKPYSWLGVFAKTDLLAGQELSASYGYSFWSSWMREQTQAKKAV